MSTLAAASLNRDVIYVGQSDCGSTRPGSWCPPTSPSTCRPIRLRDRPGRCVCERPPV